MTLTAHETAQRAWINGDPAAAALAELADLTDADDALGEAEEALKDAKAEIAALRQVMADVATQVSEAAGDEGDLLMALEDAAAVLRNALR